MTEDLQRLRAWATGLLEMEQRATPGPWRIGSINYADVFGPDGEPVAFIPKGYEETGPTAQLIAASRNALRPLAEMVLGLLYQVEICWACCGKGGAGEDCCPRCTPYRALLAQLAAKVLPAVESEK